MRRRKRESEERLGKWEKEVMKWGVEEKSVKNRKKKRMNGECVCVCKEGGHESRREDN